MDGNLQQHKAFESGLTELDGYLKDVTPETYDGVKLRGIIDRFGPALAAHLADEIGTLLELDVYGGDKLLQAWNELDKKAIANIGDKVRSNLLLSDQPRNIK